MKTINNFINEKLKISSKSKTYNYYPKDKFELREILEERLAEDKNANLNDIDVSDITYMGGHLPDCGLFEGLDPHDIDVSEWDVSKVTDMCCMFYGCKNLNCDLKNWDVSKVTDMSYMFYDCENLNCDLSNWNISNVKHMGCMFKGCKNFTGKGLENWDVSNVKVMNSMFEDCIKLKCDLGNWDVSKAEDMRNMFYGCIGFVGKGLENWDVSKVKTMERMFKYCPNLCCELNDWNVQNYTDTGSMFDKTPIGDEYPYPDWYE